MIGKQKLNFVNEKEWPKGTPKDWANESHGVAYSSVYIGVAADDPPPHLTLNYVERRRGIRRSNLPQALAARRKMNRWPSVPMRKHPEMR